ncbi:MAG: HAMP domain-containing histidine kinase [Candidatus Marinimicrobia bacterium]|nr:HAMP domain-containing histidine kinase [Candidatus Neomarinimicrobiota bacterium]
MKLSPKVIMLVLGVLVVSMSLLSIPLYWYSRVALEEELGDQLKRINRIMVTTLDKELVSMLAAEPGLESVRQSLEASLSVLAVPGIEGLTLYKQDGTILAQDKHLKQNIARLSPALPALLSLKNDQDPVVSEIYKLDQERYVKAAAIPIRTNQGSQVILVVWVGANYMAVINQMAGSLLWIMLASFLIAIAMTLVFSRSLIKPVRALSGYAKAIQTNINSEPVELRRSDEFGELNQSLIDMHRDIQKQEESARQLLAGIAHEIKNPLGGMEIYSGLLSEELSQLPADAKFEEYKSYLKKITEELHHLKRIVQEYLDYARPLKSVIETLSIREIYTDITKILQPELTTLNQTIHLEGDTEIQADRSKLQRVFLNLIRNGLEASGENGQTSIHISDSSSTLEIDFIDTGTGIPESDRQRIFEPYFSTRDRGFGLGLSIVQSIVAELGGTIVVQKSDAEGTVFRMRLPRKDQI